MAINYLKLALTVGMISASLTACKPAEAPPDLLKTQRESLEKAKAVEGQIQRQAQEQMKALEDAQK
jgi:hypothetical protein